MVSDPKMNMNRWIDLVAEGFAYVLIGCQCSGKRILEASLTLFVPTEHYFYYSMEYRTTSQMLMYSIF